MDTVLDKESSHRAACPRLFFLKITWPTVVRGVWDWIPLLLLWCWRAVWCLNRTDASPLTYAAHEKLRLAGKRKKQRKRKEVWGGAVSNRKFASARHSELLRIVGLPMQGILSWVNSADCTHNGLGSSLSFPRLAINYLELSSLINEFHSSNMLCLQPKLCHYLHY